MPGELSFLLSSGSFVPLYHIDISKLKVTLVIGHKRGATKLAHEFVEIYVSSNFYRITYLESLDAAYDILITV